MLCVYFTTIKKIKLTIVNWGRLCTFMGDNSELVSIRERKPVKWSKPIAAQNAENFSISFKNINYLTG